MNQEHSSTGTDANQPKRAAILIVDGVRVNRAVLMEIFSPRYEILEAGDGQQALALLYGGRTVSAVILDLAMPETDGFGVLAAMQTDPVLTRIPVIAMTAAGDENRQLRALDSGARDVIERPVRPEIVRRRVENLIACTEAAGRRTEEHLRLISEENEQLLSIIARHLRKYLVRFDFRTGLLRPCGRTTGIPGNRALLPRPEDYLCGGIVAPESAEKMTGVYRAMLAGTPEGGGKFRARIADGTWKWYSCVFSTVFDQGGEPDYAVLIIDDITDSYEKELAYQAWRENVSSSIAGGASYMEVNLSADRVERAFGFLRHFIGKYSDNVLRSISDVCPENQEAFREAMDVQQLIHLYHAGVSHDSLEYRFRDGRRWRWYRMTILMTAQPYSNDVMGFFSVYDIDREKRESERLTENAHMDPVTGIRNRASAEEEIRKIMETAGLGTRFAFFMMDVDNFKAVNDTYGHQQGDATLVQVGRAISDFFRAGDIVGRIGGDEFVAFISHANMDSVRRKAAGLLDALQFSVGDIVLTSSIGVALTNGEKTDYAVLYGLADQAMYHAKRKGKNQFAVLDLNAKLIADESAGETETVQLQTLLKFMDGGIVTGEYRGGELKITYASPSLNRYLELQPERVGAHPEQLFNRVNPEDREMLRTNIIEVARSGEFLDCSFRVGESGKEWRRLRGMRLPQQKGNAIRLLGVVSDITSLKSGRETRK
jgi:diguanylate cyclase (GGDEF)-like protein